MKLSKIFINVPYFLIGVLVVGFMGYIQYDAYVNSLYWFFAYEVFLVVIFASLSYGRYLHKRGR